MKTTAFFLSMLLTMLLSGVVSGQQKPTTGYAPVNGMNVYYEIHGSGAPVGQGLTSLRFFAPHTLG